MPFSNRGKVSGKKVSRKGRKTGSSLIAVVIWGRWGHWRNRGLW